jgi:hypothetical protein
MSIKLCIMTPEFFVLSGVLEPQLKSMVSKIHMNSRRRRQEDEEHRQEPTPMPTSY